MILQVLLILPLMWVLIAAIPLGRWEKDAMNSWERWIYRAAIGMGVLSYLVFGLGMMGALNRITIGMLLGIFLLIALIRFFRSKKDQSDNGPFDSFLPLSFYTGGQKALAAGIGVLTLLMVIGCASPPSGGDWDGLSYHLADPKIFLREGRILPLPWEHHSNFPFLVQMLFTVGLAFKSVGFAKAFHLSMGLLTAAALITAYWRIHRDTQEQIEPEETGGTKISSSLLPAALFLGAPLAFWESTVAYVDLGATLYAFLAIYAFTMALGYWKGKEEHRRNWLLLSGGMTGFAIGCKTTNGIFLLLLLAWGGWELLRSSKKRLSFADLVIRFALPAALVAAPWFIKSYLWTGNPVYPFFYGIFGGVNWNEQLAKTYETEQAIFGMGRDPASLLLLPWNLTFHADQFSRGIGQFASLGPYALAFLPLLVLARPLPRWAKAYLTLTLVFFVIWIALTQQIRYLLPLWPVMCLLASFAAERATLGKIGRHAVDAFTGVALLLTIYQGFRHVSPMIPVALGMTSPSAFLNQSSLGRAAEFINRETPPSARILMIEETRGFYLDRDYMWGNPGHHTLIPWDSFQTPEDLNAWLHSQGFTHILINSQWMRKGWGSSPWENLLVQGMNRGLLTPVFSDRSIQVYQLRF